MCAGGERKTPALEQELDTMRSTVLTLSLVAALMAGGCASTRVQPAPEPAAEVDAFNSGLREVAARSMRGGPTLDYVIDPPDVVSIYVKDNEDLSGTEITVGPDGKISRPLIGVVTVAGKTVAEVSEELRQLYGEFLRDASVTVMVTGYKSKFVYVDGEVRRPGRYAYTGNDSVVNALAQSGFLTKRASPNGIHVARGNPNDPEIYPVRLKDIIVDDDSRTNWLLEPDDIVYVPPSFLSRIGYVMEEIFFPFALPLQMYNQYDDVGD